MPDHILRQRIAEAWEMIRKGDRFGTARRFLKQHAIQ